MSRSQTDGLSKAGFVHPGQMGVTIAAALASGGHAASWASQGRSAATADRAAKSKLNDLSTLEALCNDSQFIFSVCPPDQSCAVAQQVTDTGFNGIYVDCNAIAPSTAEQVGKIVSTSGADFVDGGIIGPPATRSGTTRLYLSGDSAPEVAELFADSLVDARALGSKTGAASALKMAYAGWTKGSAALLMTQFAFAKQLDVESALLEEWALSQAGLAAKLDSACTSSAPKAWRFAGEMREIAKALDDSGLPKTWFDGAADVYQRLSELKSLPDADRERVIATLLENKTGDSA